MRLLAAILPLIATLGCAADIGIADTDRPQPEYGGGTAGDDTSAPPAHDDDGGSDDPDTNDQPQQDNVDDIYQTCFSEFMGSDYDLPDYDAAGAIINSSCTGTDHQDIQGIERVVFVGDSITVGSPPTDSTDWYRNVLADDLADRYGLEKPGWAWQNVDILSGDPWENFDGDFGVCAWWGARTDDLLLSNQLPDCMPESARDKTTLVVITAGGNDVFKQIQAQMEGESDATIAAEFDEWVQLMRDALEWLTDPANFEAPVYVVFANVYEYSDGTGQLSSCPGADMVGYGLADTGYIDKLTTAAMGEYLQMAVDTQTDMLFMREAFCGHGFNAGDSRAPCYRGSNAATWFDETCIHPNAAGHDAIAEMFKDVIYE